MKVENKVCRHCKEELSLEHFWVSKYSDDGLWATCIKCAMRWKRENGDVLRKSNPAIGYAYARRAQSINATTLAEQGGKCAICGIKQEMATHKFVRYWPDPEHVQLVCPLCRPPRK